jgi:quercetin dioxygenase-like cupin family protein
MELYKNTHAIPWESGKIKGFSSKSLIALKNGDSKIVKITPSAKYPTHKHPHKTESLLVLQGALNVTIDNTEHEGKPFDFFVFPSGVEHNITNPYDADCIVFISSINN